MADIRFDNAVRISPAYLAEQRRMHAEHRYGHSGGQWAETVFDLSREFGARSVLDYGCGTAAMTNRLRKMRRLIVADYDPAVPGKDQAPSPADLVTCLDVLEHIEPDYLGNVVAQLASLTRKVLFAVICTRLAGKILSDGRNAHLIVRPAQWWRERMGERFYLVREWTAAPEVYCTILRPIQ